MLDSQDYKILKSVLHDSERPFFLYDNDADGLCAFILARRALGKGDGEAIKSYPELISQYAEKAIAHGADSVFVFDRNTLSPEFVSLLQDNGISIFVVDHHPRNSADFKGVTYFSSSDSSLKSNSLGISTSEIIFNALGNKKDSWIALMGCISDYQIPKFAKEVIKEYPNLFSKNILNPGDILFSSSFGKLIRTLNFGLKDSLSAVRNLQNYLISINYPDELLIESDKNKNILEHFGYLEKKYISLLKRTEELSKDLNILFRYSSKVSLNSELANELIYKNPDKIVCVAYVNDSKVNLSLRGKGILKKFERMKKEVSSLEGGGHPDAVGGRLNLADFDSFKKAFESL